MKSWIAGAGLIVATLTMTASPAFGDAAPSVTEARPKPPLVPNDFRVPTSIEAAGFKIVPLGPEVVKVDFDAYMSSIEHLQTTFTRSATWPHKNISQADAMQDMRNEQARFQARTSFAYAVLTPDGSRELGSVYVQPSPVEGYDAVVRMWVTKADFDAGFDAELYSWVSEWVRKDWPFTKVAYPGRTIEWAAWDSLVARNKIETSAAQ